MSSTINLSFLFKPNSSASLIPSTIDLSITSIIVTIVNTVSLSIISLKYVFKKVKTINP
jgi:hypothetical protein